VILLARGGGSLEDLWCFNDERIARVIRELNAPVVTGVGHETDTTLVDGSSDRRAPTPSAGAELITPNIQQLREQIEEMRIQIADATQYTIDTRHEQLSEVYHKLRLLSPASHIRNERQRLDEQSERLAKAMNNHILAARRDLQSRSHALDVANPRNLLDRGYAIVTRAMDNKRVTNAVDAGPGTSIAIQLGKGTLTATVKDRKLDE
jgi:exodeoxyribonuclease VII large subunit